KWMHGSRQLPNAPAGSKYILASAVLPAVPRREKTFELRLYDQTRNLIGKFNVRNPVYRDYPTWKPESLPATHTTGDLTVSLVGLTNRWVSGRYEGLEVRRFSLTPDFRLPADWELSDIDVEDATGNRAVADILDQIRRRMLMFDGTRKPVAKEFQLCTN